jgi:hypothetical protein
MDKVTVNFKGRVVFRQYIPKKQKCFRIKMYKLCDEAGYTYRFAYRNLPRLDSQHMLQGILLSHNTL